MIQAQIQQHLDAPGRKAFAGWLRFFAKVARQFDGFINLQILQVEGDSSLTMVVIFEDKNQLDQFFKSPIFAQLMSKMDRHAIKPYTKKVFRTKNMYDYRRSSEKAAETDKGMVRPQPDQIGAQVGQAQKPVVKVRSQENVASSIRPKRSRQTGL